jgi:hypothetical protein
LNAEYVFLIANDWEYEWKISSDQMSHLEGEKEKDSDEEELDKLD